MVWIKPVLLHQASVPLSQIVRFLTHIDAINKSNKRELIKLFREIKHVSYGERQHQ